MRLMGKLKVYGVEGNVAKWITEYLSNRSQVVVVNGEKYVAEQMSSVVYLKALY